MRHTVHMMFGQPSEQILTDIKKYIIKYGSEAENGFFNAMLFCEDTECARLYKAVPREENALEFVSGLENLFTIGLEEWYTIPNKGRAEYMQSCFDQLYSQLITINNPGDYPELHVCLYVPLYDKRYWSITTEILNAVKANDQRPFDVDIFMVPADLAYLFTDQGDDTLPMRKAQYEKQVKATVKEMLAAKKAYPFLRHLILMQNCNVSGISLNLDEDSLVRIIGEFALLTINHYGKMFPLTGTDKERPIHALGLSVLSFDKYYFVQYLLHRAYRYILDREKIMQEEVNVNKVSGIVQAILTKNVNVFSRFYKEHVEPRLIKKEPQEKIIAEIHPELMQEIERLTEEFQSYIDSEEYSLPEKKAALAQLLGEDDELLIGYMFNKQQLVIDDCSREVLDFFVEANNALFRNEKTRDLAVLSVSTGEEAVLPSVLLDELKEIKVDMRESSNYIRVKTAELEALGVQMQEHTQSHKRLTENGFVFEGNVFQLQRKDVIERALDEDYIPLGTVPAKADLRQYFTPVKNQGGLGACTAFSLVSIFEYILHKNQQKVYDLSESFAYYNVRRRTNTLGQDNGSSLYDMIMTLGTEGLCSEELCPYTEEVAMPEPSVEAYNDAQQRKVIKALNVSKDLKAIKSAVSQGYPVAISLRIFDSFLPVSGFIPRPSSQEIEENQYGNHAMVVCGYSDEEKIFVVRNSWGTNFGDQGYCYIPYSYFEDFLNMACIITEVNTTNVHVEGNDSKVTISFDMANAHIKAVILQVLIEEAKRKVAQRTEELQAKEFEYNKIFQALGNNSTREALCTGTVGRRLLEREECKQRIDKLQQERIEKLEKYKKETFRRRFYFAINAILFVAVYLLLWLWIGIPAEYLFLNNYSYSAYGYMVLSIIYFIYWNWRRHHGYVELDEEYQMQIEHEEREVKRIDDELEIIKLKSHVAGMIIDSLAKLFYNLHSKYNGMRSYVGNLKEWRKEEEVACDMVDTVQDPFISLISNSKLDEYFLKHMEEITGNIRLYRLFRNEYHIEDEQIIKFKNEKLKHLLIKELFARLDSFSIYKHITGEETYDYAERNTSNLYEMLRKLDEKSNPFVRVLSTAASASAMNTRCKLLFLDTDLNAKHATWENNFQTPPDFCRDDSRFKITLLQLNALSESEIAIIKS